MESTPTIKTVALDPTVKPTDDFYHYVNGRWLKNNPIPAEESRWGSFIILRIEVEQQLKAIIDELSQTSNVEPGSNAQKIRDFYLTAMDTKKLNQLGTQPIKNFEKMIDDIRDLKDLISVTARLQRAGITAWWSPSVEQDEKNSRIMALHLSQGGLGLPDRDYYTDEDKHEIRQKYRAYITDLCELMRIDSAAQQRYTDVIMDLETQLAQVSMTAEERRDIPKQYNKMSFTELQTLTPAIDWPLYFQELQTTPPEYVIVAQPEFFKKVNLLFETTSLDDLKTYLHWHLLNSLSQYLSEAFEQRSFDFYAKVFSGTAEMKPHWRRVLHVLDSLLEQALGQLYIKRHFSESAKHRINELVDHLIDAYRARIEQLDWMSTATKTKALEKLARIDRKLGYPDVWKDFSTLSIGTESYADNYMRACAFHFDRDFAKIGKPIDRTEWHMPPQTVNAYYNPAMNEIVFPAAILQPPFFDPEGDDAINYGGIGGVIGHELTHGFDDQGALFDAEGNMRNWWTDEDKQRFDEKTARYAEQFSQYEPLPGVHINGKLTLGENIADLGGMAIAYDGFQKALAEKPTGTIDGFKPEQRFFINWAVCWCENIREELLRHFLLIEVHAPEQYRTNGPLSNMPEFYETFGAKPGNQLWRKPEDRVKVW